MARSHHRKKHKEHLRQYKHREETTVTPAPSKAAGVFSIVGAVIGLAVSYFGSEGAIFWVITGLLVGAASGYFVGRNIDKGK